MWMSQAEIHDAVSVHARPAVGFEVASVNQNKTALGPSQIVVPGRGNLSAQGVPTLWLIYYVWDITHRSRVKGNPGWLLSEYCDVRAIPPEVARSDSTHDAVAVPKTMPSKVGHRLDRAANARLAALMALPGWIANRSRLSRGLACERPCQHLDITRLRHHDVCDEDDADAGP
jgi:hypothetical protein